MIGALLIVAVIVLVWYGGAFCALWWIKDTYPTAFSVLVQEMKWRKAERQEEKARQEGGGRTMNVKRGDIVAWWREPHVPLKVISDPYPFAGGGRNRDGAEDREEKG